MKLENLRKQKTIPTFDLPVEKTLVLHGLEINIRRSVAETSIPAALRLTNEVGDLVGAALSHDGSADPEGRLLSEILELDLDPRKLFGKGKSADDDEAAKTDADDSAKNLLMLRVIPIIVSRFGPDAYPRLAWFFENLIVGNTAIRRAGTDDEWVEIESMGELNATRAPFPVLLKMLYAAFSVNFFPTSGADVTNGGADAKDGQQPETSEPPAATPMPENSPRTKPRSSAATRKAGQSVQMSTSVG